MRTVTKHEDDIWPVATVWLPTGIITYIVVYLFVERLLLNLGYSHRIPVEIVGGGESTTVQMTAASYHAGPIAITAMLFVILGWYVRDWMVKQ